MLRSAGYMVSKIDDDGILETLAGASHVDGVVVELPALRAIAVARRIQAQAANVVMLIIASPPETVRRALVSVPVLPPATIGDDLVSGMDLALAARQLRQTG
jgi:hypothetical protein